MHNFVQLIPIIYKLYFVMQASIEDRWWYEQVNQCYTYLQLLDEKHGTEVSLSLLLKACQLSISLLYTFYAASLFVMIDWLLFTGDFWSGQNADWVSHHLPLCLEFPLGQTIRHCSGTCFSYYYFTHLKLLLHTGSGTCLCTCLHFLKFNKLKCKIKEYW